MQTSLPLKAAVVNRHPTVRASLEVESLGSSESELSRF